MTNTNDPTVLVKTLCDRLQAAMSALDESDFADEQARPMVQRILDGELGDEAALAVTRLVLDLTHARGTVQALEREIQADRTPWQVVDTSPDTQADISGPEIATPGGEQ